MNKILPIYKKTQDRIIFWVYSIIGIYCLYILNGHYKYPQDYNYYLSEISVQIFQIIGFTYPFFLVYFLIKKAYVWNYGEEIMPEGYSNKFNPRKRAFYLINQVDNLSLNDSDTKLIAKNKEELKDLIKKYQSDLHSEKKLREDQNKQREKASKKYQEKIVEWKERQNQSRLEKLGDIVPQIICPYCQVKGKVRRGIGENIEESREKGFVGGIIGRKTITSKGKTNKFYCENCGTSY